MRRNNFFLIILQLLLHNVVGQTALPTAAKYIVEEKVIDIYKSLGFKKNKIGLDSYYTINGVCSFAEKSNDSLQVFNFFINVSHSYLYMLLVYQEEYLIVDAKTIEREVVLVNKFLSKVKTKDKPRLYDMVFSNLFYIHKENRKMSLRNEIIIIDN
jgi:hypothetical protein